MPIRISNKTKVTKPADPQRERNMKNLIRQTRRGGLALWGLYLSSLLACAQGYAPTTKWPYLYDEFQPGTVFFSDGQASRQQMVNIHLLHCTLHYLEGDKIKQSDARGIETIVIAADTFLYHEGELVRLLKRNGQASLIKQVAIDMDALNKGQTGAYGMETSSSAVSQLTSFEVNGVANLNHTQMKLEKAEGKELTLDETYYLVRKDRSIRASRKEIEKSLPESERERFKAFIKEHKIKWKEENSLIKLLDFFAEQYR